MKRIMLGYIGLCMMSMASLSGGQEQQSVNLKSEKTPILKGISVSPAKLLISVLLLSSAQATLPNPQSFFCVYGNNYGVCSHYQEPFALDYGKLPSKIKQLCHRTPECLSEPSVLEASILKNKFNKTGSTIACRYIAH